MKVLVLSVACGSGANDEVRAALRTIENVAVEMLESGATPYLFDLPDEAKKYTVKVEEV